MVDVLALAAVPVCELVGAAALVWAGVAPALVPAAAPPAGDTPEAAAMVDVVTAAPLDALADWVVEALLPPRADAWTIGRWAAASMADRGARLPQPEKRSAPAATDSAAAPIPFENRLREPAARRRL